MDIMFDIDGVLLDFVTAFTDWSNYKYDERIVPKSDSWDMGFPDFDNRLKQFAIDGGHNRMRAYPHAVYVFNQFASRHKIHIVTATELKNRLTVLRNQGFETSKIFDAVTTDDKANEVYRRGIRVCVEDAPHHIEKLVEKACDVYAPRYKYNDGNKSPQVHYYDDIMELLDRIGGQE
jgi:phosphoglycolate phosphatase-like HAD superfamily hydrolase